MYLKIIGAIVAAYLLFDDEDKTPNTNTPKRDNMNSLFFPPVQPLIVRNDDWGKGHFKASRGSRKHSGIDFRVNAGDIIRSPLTGYMKRPSNPYRNDPRWTGIYIIGTGEHEGYEMKIWYMTPAISTGQQVQAGQIIGFAQAISGKYDSRMFDHIHVQFEKWGNLVDPAPLFALPTV